MKFFEFLLFVLLFYCFSIEVQATTTFKTTTTTTTPKTNFTNEIFLNITLPNESTEIDVTTVKSGNKDSSNFNSTTNESRVFTVTNSPLIVSTKRDANVEIEEEDYDETDDVTTKLDDLVNNNKEEEEEEENENVEESSSDDYYNDDDDEEEDEDGEYEERCTLKSLLSTMNITEMFPEDHNALSVEYEQLEDNPKQIRIAPSVNYTFQRINRLINLAHNIANKQELRSGITNFLHHNFDLFLELDLGSPCLNSIISILVSIRKSELWAFKFFDSAPKLPSGILTGMGAHLGNFDQCISIESATSSAEIYEGQYCIIKPVLPLPDIQTVYVDEQSNESLIIQTEKILNFYSHYNVDQYLKNGPVLKFVEIMKSNKGRMTNFAICLPNVCNANQLEIALNKFLYPIIGIPLEIQESSCWTKKKIKDYSLYLDEYAQFSLAVIGTLSTIVIITTIYEVYPWFVNKNHFQDEMMVKSPTVTSTIINSMVAIFSAMGNTRQLLMTSHRFMVFDTLRLIIIILIGLSNAFYLTPLSQALHNISQSVPHELLSNPKYFFIRAPSLLNDGLLIISGALFVRSIFRHLIQPHNTITYLLYFIMRWIRLTLPLFGAIQFIYLLPSTGFGPLWYRLIEILMPPCNSPSSLASSLFHYSNWNFIKSNYTNDEAYVVCNPDTWFISIIFQLNLIFFTIVLLMYHSPKRGLRFLIIIILSSILLNIFPRLFYSNIRTYYELIKQPSLWHFRRSFYLYHQNILQYIGSFSVGVLLGYAIIINENVTKDPKSNNHYKNQKRTFTYNLIAFLGIITPFIWVNQFFIQNQSPNEMSVLLFFSIGRFIFSLSFAWILYACVSNKSPILKFCLTPSFIQPVTKLSLAIFLVQPLVQYHRMYSVKETYVMTFRNTIEHYFCDFIISIFFAYILYLLFEAPAVRLNGYLRRKNLSDNNYFDTDNRDYWCDNSKTNTSTLTNNMNKNNRSEMNSKEDCYEQNGIISIRF